MESVNKAKVVFVLLHYNEIGVTHSAIEHIRKLEKSEVCHIVVVDNCSPDKSGTALMGEFANDSFVSVIQTPQNLGFAKGNNYGYAYAKRNFSPGVIVVMNNDVMIEQANFVPTLLGLPVASEYEILLPVIINKEGVNQNPFREKGLSTGNIVSGFLNVLLLNVIYSIPGFNKWWMRRRKDKKTRNEHICQEASMMVPHGACVIFTHKWISSEDIAFVPDTFLYGEEDLLFEYVMSKGYHTYFTKALTVHHLEDVSTNSVITNQLAKDRFLLKNLLVSHKLLLKMRLSNKKKSPNKD